MSYSDVKQDIAIDADKQKDKIKGKKRFLEMDVARALSAIAVIIIHTSAYTLSGIKDKGSDLYYITLIVNQLARFSVPVFFFISGVGVALSYKKNTNYFKFELKRLLNVIPEYLIWCFIYLYVIKNNRDFNTWLPLILKGDKVYYHFYFVPAIIKLYIFFPVLYSVMKSKMGLLASFLLTAGVITSGHYFNVPNLRLDFYSKRNVIFWIFYFALGIYASTRLYTYTCRLKKYKVLAAICYALCTAFILMESIQGLHQVKPLDYHTTFIRPSIIVYSISIIVFLFSLNYRENLLLKFLKSISDKSYVMYLAHPSVLYYYMEYLKGKRVVFGSMFFLISSTVICILVTLLMGMVLGSIKKLIIKKDF